MMVPWSPAHQTQRLQVTRKQLETKEQAAFPLGGASPCYLYLASNQSNKWGHPCGYRIQTVSFAAGPLPQNSSMEREVSWGRWVGCIVGGLVEMRRVLGGAFGNPVQTVHEAR